MAFDLVCFSHLRWDFVYQRPQHLLSRCAKGHRVFFVEEPEYEEGPAGLRISQPVPGVWVARPHVPSGLAVEHIDALCRALLTELFIDHAIERYVLWYYTPMALSFSRHLAPLAVIYDCMDELSLFAGAPPVLREREQELFRRADLVFAGGQSLYTAKRQQHPNVHAFPSSVDTAHFASARQRRIEPTDQRRIPHPRLGFYGVIDERLDTELVAAIADLRLEWHLILVGPVVKIDAASLPKRKNLHYLGAKEYADLPSYLAGWDVAIMPFAHNDATRFISPTKTLEFLAAGKPVVSTGITDVVTPYGRDGLVRIAESSEDFVAAVTEALDDDIAARLPAIDRMLATTSWDRTWSRMETLIEEVMATREGTVLPLPIATLVKGVSVKEGAKYDQDRVLPFPTGAERLARRQVAVEGVE